MTDISVIIVTYNPGITVLQCINSIPVDIKDSPVEIILVDNNSSDGTIDKVYEAFPRVNTISSEANLGYGAGNNVGFKHSSGKFITIMNPDVVLRDGALEKMIAFMMANSDVGIVGPRTYDNTGKTTSTARKNYTVLRLLGTYLGISQIIKRIMHGDKSISRRQFEEPMTVDWLQGSTLMIRREVYEALGGFDENFFLFMEDVDLCARARELGWRVVYLPSAEVEHIGSESVSRFHEARVRSYQISPLYYYRKRRAHTSVRILKAGFIAALLLKIVFRSFRNLFRNNETRAEKIRVEWKVLREIIQY